MFLIRGGCEEGVELPDGLTSEIGAEARIQLKNEFPIPVDRRDGKEIIYNVFWFDEKHIEEV